jgi:hypothetical protein
MRFLGQNVKKFQKSHGVASKMKQTEYNRKADIQSLQCHHSSWHDILPKYYTFWQMKPIFVKRKKRKNEGRRVYDLMNATMQKVYNIWLETYEDN